MNVNTYILLCVFAMHVLADHVFQGILASMKQRLWWLDELRDKYADAEGKLSDRVWKQYRNDYKMALLMHSYLWSFMIMLPLGIAMYFRGNLISESITVCLLLVANVLLHYIIDDLKANLGIFNLIEDQSLHIVQMLITTAILLNV